MTFRKSILLFVSLTMIAALVACSSTPAVTTPTISVALGTTPSALYVNDTVSVTATVTNDATNAGVSWSCAVGTNTACGTFSSTTSASGAAVTYTAPASTGTVTITATSVANTSDSSAPASITINATSGYTVTLTPAPPTILVPGATAVIAATTADPAGVVWSCTPASTCGTFTLPTTNSNVFGITYTAAGPGLVTITATSVTDDALSASAPVTQATAAAGVLTPSSNYAFSLAGWDEHGPYTVSGVFTVDSTGLNITGGEQDFLDNYAGPRQDTGLTGTIAPLDDGTGNLTITINTGDTNIGPGGNGIETLVATLTTGSSATIAEYDDWAESNGSLDVQDPVASAAVPAGGYAFMIRGWIPYSGIYYNYCVEDEYAECTYYYPLAMGGIINVDGTGTISGNGSMYDANFDGSGTEYQGQGFVLSPSYTQGVSAPDAFGRVVFTLIPNNEIFGYGLIPNNQTANLVNLQLVGYIVDSSRIRLVETTDGLNVTNPNTEDIYYGLTGGTALSQGANTGAFSDATNVADNSYVFGMDSYDEFGALQTVGLLTSTSGSFAGFMNYNDLSQGLLVQNPDPITQAGGAYTVAPTGVVSIPGVTDASGYLYTNLQLYLDGNGNALALTLDEDDMLSGVAYQQTGGGSFSAGSFYGTYAMNAGGVDWSDGDPFAAVGPITADGVGTLTGSVDVNWYLETFADVQLAGTFVAGTNAASGILTDTLTGLDLDTCDYGSVAHSRVHANDAGCNVDHFVYYLIDNTRAFTLEVDPNQLTFGYLKLLQ